MKGKLFVATTAAAALLALATACGGEKVPTPTPTPHLGAPYSCVEPGKSPIAHLSPGVSFDVGSVAKADFVCDQVLNLEDYVIVFGGKSGPYSASSAASIFKKVSETPYGFGFIGITSNFGHYTNAVIVNDYRNLGDILVLGSIINFGTSEDHNIYNPENNLMLNAIAEAHGFRNFHDDRSKIYYGSKVAVYRLDTGRPIEQVTKFEPAIGSDGRQTGFRQVVAYEVAKSLKPIEIQPYTTGSGVKPVVLEKIAAWPVLFGWDVEIEGMSVVEQDRKPMLEIKTSEIKPNGNRCQLIPGVVNLELVIKGGIVTDVPLLKDVYCK